MDRKIDKVHKVESVIDLGLVNYVPHPKNPDYVVFRFTDIKKANEFERRLTEANIWFEKGEEESRTRQRLYYLFGVHERDYNAVQKINYEVEAKMRSFIIKNNIFRWVLLIFVLGVMSLAMYGYCTRPDMMTSDTVNTVDE
ncbi:MAG: hypothetical protein H3C31_11670 [Brumimicrobium sp.]|nr:hypothetical protein [Brumimicrobium sp.]MCO5268672.1 hypothetical protein [Brumimicrobium sp.]